MSNLCLVRHGQASAHAVNADFLESDYDKLSPLGKSQSLIVGATIAHSLHKDEKATVLSGPLARQSESAKAIATQIPPQRFRAALLFEGSFSGRREKPPFIRKDDGWREYPLRVLKPYVHPRHPGTKLSHQITLALEEWTASEDETFCSFRESVLRSFQRAITETEDGTRRVIVTSAGPIGICVAEVLGCSPQDWVNYATRIPNGSITTFSLRNGQLSLASFNDYSHLIGPSRHPTPEVATYL